MASLQSALNDLFNDIIDSVQDGIYDSLNDVGKDVVDDAVSNLEEDGHVDTGRLRDSIHHEVTRDGNVVRATITANAKGRNGEEYAQFIEYGTGNGVESWQYKDLSGQWHTTKGMDADPFMEPALDDNEKDFRDSVSDGIEQGLKKVRGGVVHVKL